MNRAKAEPLTVPDSVNAVWPRELMPGKLTDGRTRRLVNAIDGYNRGALGIDIAFSLPSERVVRCLDQIIKWRGRLKVLCCENCPEYACSAIIGCGEPKEDSTCGISNPTSRNRTPTSIDLIERHDTTGSRSIASMRSTTFKTSRQDGSATIITNFETWLGQVYSETAAGYRRIMSTSQTQQRRGYRLKCAISFILLASALWKRGDTRGF
jgi:hypothetical protein